MRHLKEKIEASMGLKLVALITGEILALMVLSTAFVARTMTANQYRHIETRGKDMGMFLGKAVTDTILQKDMMKFNSLVADAVKSRDMFYTYVTDASDAVLNNVYSSFNRENPELREFLSQNTADNMPALAAKVKAQFDVLEVPVGQAKAGKDITVAVENMSAKITLVNRAAGDVQTGSNMIVKAIERIKQIANENASQAAGLNSAVEIMVDQAGSLKNEIQKFRM